MSYVDTIFKQILITSLLFMYLYYLSNVKIMDLENEYIKIWKRKMRYFWTDLDHTSQSVILKYYQSRSFISYIGYKDHILFVLLFLVAKTEKGSTLRCGSCQKRETPKHKSQTYNVCCIPS